jgi:hypothetical protein
MRGRGFNRGICKPVPGQMDKSSLEARPGYSGESSAAFSQTFLDARLGAVRLASCLAASLHPSVCEGRELHGASSANAAHGHLALGPAAAAAPRKMRTRALQDPAPSEHSSLWCSGVMSVPFGPGVRVFRLGVWGVDDREGTMACGYLAFRWQFLKAQSIWLLQWDKWVFISGVMFRRLPCLSLPIQQHSKAQQGGNLAVHQSAKCSRNTNARTSSGETSPTAWDARHVCYLLYEATQTQHCQKVWDYYPDEIAPM